MEEEEVDVEEEVSADEVKVEQVEQEKADEVQV